LLLVEGSGYQEATGSVATCWKPYLKETNIMLEDATCYETSMRYPTNVKLLWESTEWSYYQLRLMCKYLKIRMPRNKYEEQWDKYNNYSHKRKRTHKETAKRTRSLLYLLEKILRLLNEIENRYQEQLELSKAYYQKIKIIRKVLKQQQEILKQERVYRIVL